MLAFDATGRFWVLLGAIGTLSRGWKATETSVRLIPHQSYWDERILNFESGAFDHSATLPAHAAHKLCSNFSRQQVDLLRPSRGIRGGPGESC